MSGIQKILFAFYLICFIALIVAQVIDPQLPWYAFPVLVLGLFLMGSK